MADKIVLHIGSVKTGSSALQSAFVRNRNWLQENGILYPADGSDADAEALKITSGNGMRLASALNEKLPFSRNYSPENAFNEVVAHAKQAAEKQVLYSSEQMSFFEASKLQGFADICKSHGIQLQIVFVFRNITGHAYSSYNQMVKRHLYKDSFTQFIQNGYFSRFASITKSAIGILGQENFIPISYDIAKDAILSNFVAALGVDPVGVQEITERVNRSLSRIELEMMRVVNRSMKTEKDSKTISDAIIYSDPEKRTSAVISDEERRVIFEKFLGQKNEVNEMLGQNVLSIIGDDVDVQDSEAVSLSEAEKAMLSIFSVLYMKAE